MQKAVRKHSALLQTELDHLKAKLNVRSNTDLLSHRQNRKLELLLFSFLLRVWKHVDYVKFCFSQPLLLSLLKQENSEWRIIKN